MTDSMQDYQKQLDARKAEAKATLLYYSLEVEEAELLAKLGPDGRNMVQP